MLQVEYEVYGEDELMTCDNWKELNSKRKEGK